MGEDWTSLTSFIAVDLSSQYDPTTDVFLPLRLENLHLRDCWSKKTFERAEKLDQLKVLKIQEVTLPHGGLFLKAIDLPNLQELHLGRVHFNDLDRVHDTAEVVFLTALHTLQLEGCSSKVTRFVFNHVQTPSLTTMALRINDNLRNYVEPDAGEETTTSALLASLEPGLLPQLKHLSIGYCELNPSSKLLQSLTSLESLHINACNLDDTSLVTLAGLYPDATQILSETGSRTFACPNLQRLTLNNEISLTSDVIRRIVEERAAAGQHQLRTVVLQGWDESHLDSDDLDVIQSLVHRLEVESFDGNDILGDGSDDSDTSWESDSVDSDGD